MPGKSILLVVPAWAALLSAIIVQRLLVSTVLTPLDWALIFASSILAGAVAGELESVVLGFAAALLLSAIMVGLVLSLPVILGFTGPAWEIVAEQQAASLIVQAYFPSLLVLVLTGAILGSALAERIWLN